MAKGNSEDLLIQKSTTELLDFFVEKGEIFRFFSDLHPIFADTAGYLP